MNRQIQHEISDKVRVVVMSNTELILGQLFLWLFLHQEQMKREFLCRDLVLLRLSCKIVPVCHSSLQSCDRLVPGFPFSTNALSASEFVNGVFEFAGAETQCSESIASIEGFQHNQCKKVQLLNEPRPGRRGSWGRGLWANLPTSPDPPKSL